MPEVWDVLPGVFSWDVFEPVTALVTYQVQRRGGALSVLLVGLDEALDFSGTEVNGEELALHKTATALFQVCRGGDMIARYGPRSFAVLAPDAQEAGARRLTERLRQTLPAVLPDGEASQPLVYVIGSATAPQHGMTVNELVEHAQRSAVRGGARSPRDHSLLTPQPATADAAVAQRVAAANADRERLFTQRRTTLAYLSRAYERGSVRGIAIETESGACPVCLDAARDIYRPQAAPSLPLIGCAGPVGCRCTYTSPSILARHWSIPPAAERDGELPRRLRNAAAGGADPRRGGRPEEVAELLEGFPVPAISVDLVLQPGERVYAQRAARRGIEQPSRGAASLAGLPIPIDEPLPAWLRQLSRPPSLPTDLVLGRDEGDLYITNRRLVFRDSGRRVLDSVPLLDLTTLDYLREALVCGVEGQSGRIVYQLRDALTAGLYLARALRGAAFQREPLSA